MKNKYNTADLSPIKVLEFENIIYYVVFCLLVKLHTLRYLYFILNLLIESFITHNFC